MLSSCWLQHSESTRESARFKANPQTDRRASARAGSFRTLAFGRGEYPIASLSQFNVFSVYVQYINQNKSYPAAAITLLAFGITWAAILALAAVGRGGRTAPVAEGAR